MVIIIIYIIKIFQFKKDFQNHLILIKKKKNKNNIFLYCAAKTIVRHGLNLTWAHFPHYLKNKPICRPDGSIVKSYFSNPQFSIAFIKHYATKSTEEFIKRIIRGTVNSKMKYTNYLNFKIKKYYFFYNKFILKKKKNLKRALI